MELEKKSSHSILKTEKEMLCHFTSRSFGRKFHKTSALEKKETLIIDCNKTFNSVQFFYDGAKWNVQTFKFCFFFVFAVASYTVDEKRSEREREL